MNQDGHTYGAQTNVSHFTCSTEAYGGRDTTTHDTTTLQDVGKNLQNLGKKNILRLIHPAAEKPS